MLIASEHVLHIQTAHQPYVSRLPIESADHILLISGCEEEVKVSEADRSRNLSFFFLTLDAYGGQRRLGERGRSEATQTKKRQMDNAKLY